MTLSETTNLPASLMDQHLKHLEFLTAQLEEETGESIRCRWSLYLFDPIFRQRIVYPQLEDTILYTDVEPPYTFINKLYVRNQEDDGYEYVTISEPCHGKTMRDVWLAANTLYKRAVKEYGDWHCFLETLSMSDKYDHQYILFYGS